MIVLHETIIQELKQRDMTSYDRHLYMMIISGTIVDSNQNFVCWNQIHLMDVSREGSVPYETD